MAGDSYCVCVYICIAQSRILAPWIYTYLEHKRSIEEQQPTGLGVHLRVFCHILMSAVSHPGANVLCASICAP